MSQENVELVYLAYAAIHRRDLDTYVALHDSACQIFPRIVTIEGGAPYRGHEGVRAFWSDVQTSFTDWLPELAEVRDLGDLVIAEVHFRARGRDSGVTIDQTVWQAANARDGRLTWWAIYPSEADALEAAGLSE
jgi:ketosteroid isomerase-like protein